MTWRITLATVLLLAGVAMVAAGRLGWILGGLLCLLFVPALIVDGGAS